MEEKNKIISAVSVIVILALIGAGFYFNSRNKKIEEESRKNEEANINFNQAAEEKAEEKSDEDDFVLGSAPEINVDVSEAVKNPVEEMPSANPYENVKNPFKDSYKNPFK